MALKIQLRRGTAAEWTSANPVLMQGEMGVETDTLKVKLGNGTTAWTSLPYFTQGAKGDTGATGATGPQGAKGDKGDVGDTGPANELSVGTVTTGAAGSSAVVTITGDAPDQTISFTIPQGIQGIQGEKGDKGDTGLGVPEGGTEGQIIVRTVDGTVWQDNYARNVEQAVKNVTGSTLAKGTAVYISGASGDNALVAKAQANSEATSSKTLGLLAAAIPNDGFGAVITEGTLYGVDTSSASAGDSVWLSPSVAGGLVFGLANKPVAPNHMVYLGVVLRSHAVNGSIFVKVQNGYELDELHDVSIASPADKQVLQYEASTQLWKNKTASGGVRVSEAEPEDTISGDGWFYSEDGTLFVRYADGNSTQWVQPNAVLSSQIEQRYFSPNYVINGGFDIWQRGTSFTGNGEIYTADRWVAFGVDGSPTRTISQQAFTPGAAPVSGYEGNFFYRYAVSSAGSGNTFHGFGQRIEDVRTFAGQTITISFWAKADSNRTATVWTQQFFGSGGSSAIATQVASVSLTSGWTRYTATVSVPSVAGRTIGAGSYFVVYFVLPNATTFTFDVWGVQAELGSTASPFRRNANSLQGELAACQRYYTQNRVDFTTLTLFSSTDSWLGTTYYSLPVEMRVSPTISVWDIGGNSGQAHRQFTGSGGGVNVAVSIQYLTPKGFRFGSSVAGATDRAGMYYFQWAASAEL